MTVYMTLKGITYLCIYLCFYGRMNVCLCTDKIKLFIGVYFSGDGAMRDKDGHYQITGRVDDVINTKGHRLGTAELESVMVCMCVCLCVSVCTCLCV